MIPSVDTETVALAAAMLDTATRQLLVRTLLTVGPTGYCEFSGHIFMAEGRGREAERLVHVSLNRGNSQLPIKLSTFTVTPGDTAQQVLDTWIVDTQMKAEKNNAPWFRHWCTKDQFQGMARIETNYQYGPVAYRPVPAHHPVLQLYFGATAAGLSQLARARETTALSNEERDAAGAATRLAERFGAFVWAQQRLLVENTFGMLHD